jgi:hypothetical protein
VSTGLLDPTGWGVTFVSPVVNDLVVFDADGPAGAMGASLFAGGSFGVPGAAAPSAGIARWDGSGWHALGEGLSFSPYSVLSFGGASAADLEVFDADGEGPGAPALFIAGAFLRAGGHSSWAVASWGCATWEGAPPPCTGDATGDGAVTFADITGVLTFWLFEYAAGSGPGDANHDGAVTFADITSVLTNFGLPCGSGER